MQPVRNLQARLQSAGITEGALVRRLIGQRRIGDRQDLLALNIDLASVMQAGRWKSTLMPMRYGEEVLAARGGMARAAQAQGRDSAA